MYILLIQNNYIGNTDYLILLLANHEKCVLTATYIYYRIYINPVLLTKWTMAKPWIGRVGESNGTFSA